MVVCVPEGVEAFSETSTEAFFAFRQRKSHSKRTVHKSVFHAKDDKVKTREALLLLPDAHDHHTVLLLFCAEERIVKKRSCIFPTAKLRNLPLQTRASTIGRECTSPRAVEGVGSIVDMLRKSQRMCKAEDWR